MALQKLAQFASGSPSSPLAKCDAQVANDSFNHRSSHQLMVTRSPNHMWDSSCRIVSSRVRYEASVTRPRNTYSSRITTQPMFSIAPLLYSGTKTWSYFPNGYG